MTKSELSIYFTTKFCDIKTEEDIKILQKVEEHLIEAINLGFNIDEIFFIALEGSQNYQLDLPNSDVDTKIIVLPSLDDIVWNKKPVAMTHIRANEEHTSITDIRNYFSSLRKQNINFIETLFSPWIIVNKKYENEFEQLFDNRELIARYNECKAVKTISGISIDRYKAIQNLNSKKADIIKKYGYDGKAVSHLIRIYAFLKRYIRNFPYQDCIIPDNEEKEIILFFKQNYADKEEGLSVAKNMFDAIQKEVNDYINVHEEIINSKAEIILKNLQYSMIKKGLGI
jgi:predicted nucleotidyltransferase